GRGREGWRGGVGGGGGGVGEGRVGVGAREPGEPGLRPPPRFTPPVRKATPPPEPVPRSEAPEPEYVPEPPAAPVPVPVSARLPREWNVWELDRLARENAGSNALRDEERSLGLLHLRPLATADGVLPSSFDELVRESFGELLSAREHV